MSRWVYEQFLASKLTQSHLNNNKKKDNVSLEINRSLNNINTKAKVFGVLSESLSCCCNQCTQAHVCVCISVRADDPKQLEAQIYTLMCSIYNFSSNWPNRLQTHFVHRCHRKQRKMRTKVHSALGKQNNFQYFSFLPSVAISKRSLETLRVLWGLMSS